MLSRDPSSEEGSDDKEELSEEEAFKETPDILDKADSGKRKTESSGVVIEESIEATEKNIIVIESIPAEKTELIDVTSMDDARTDDKDIVKDSSMLGDKVVKVSDNEDLDNVQEKENLVPKKKNKKRRKHAKKKKKPDDKDDEEEDEVEEGVNLEAVQA